MPPARTSAVKLAPNPMRSTLKKAAPATATDVDTSSSTATTPTMPDEVLDTAASRVIRLPQGYIPARIPNAFLLFRSWRVRQDKASSVNQVDMSDSYSKEWNAMSDEEKAPFFSLFHKADALFMKRFPWYVYTPFARETNKMLPLVKTPWTVDTDEKFVIDAEGAVVFYETAMPLAEPSPAKSSLQVDVPAPRTAVSLVKEEEEDVAMEDVFLFPPVASPAGVLPCAQEDDRAHRPMHKFRRAPSPEGFYAAIDYMDLGRIAPKALVQSHAMDYEERSPTDEPFYMTPMADYEPTLWADFVCFSLLCLVVTN